ncbi:MAG: DUF72 domain-containing protein [Planctomycetota bacterium]
MNVLVGTSGYSYKEWKGSFYPAKLSPAKMLHHYAQQLPTVEINNTFYRMPTRKLLQGWAEQVPDGFSFALKASQRISHKKRLKECEEDLSYLTETASELGPRLGPMLFQLPPYFKKDTDRLKGFLDLLPEGWRAAFEFRNASWFDDEVYDALRARRAALVVSDTGKGGEPPVVPTASYGYLRLRREEYDPPALQAWARKIAGQPWEEAHVFFKHEEAGAGPRRAAEFGGLF